MLSGKINLLEKYALKKKLPAEVRRDDEEIRERNRKEKEGIGGGICGDVGGDISSTSALPLCSVRSSKWSRDSLGLCRRGLRHRLHTRSRVIMVTRAHYQA